MTQSEILLTAEIIKACKGSKRVSVLVDETDVVVEGVARHIVAPDAAYFPRNITMDCRLRVTSAVDVFIPLRDIVEVTVHES